MSNYQGCGSQFEKEGLKEKLDECEKLGLYVAEEKLDGQWAEVLIENGRVKKISSRTDKEKIYESLLNYQFPDWLNGILVGELGYGSSNTKLKEKIAVFYDFVELRAFGKVFDAKCLENLDRRRLLEDVFNRISKEDDKICLVERRKEKFFDFYHEVLKSGGEGLVVKKVSGPDTYYEPGTRTPTWIKVKKGVEVDMVVMGVNWRTAEGMSELTKSKGMENWIKDIICGQYRDGELVEETHVGSMTEEARKWFTENSKDAVGKVVVIRGFEQFPSGAVRHCSLATLPDGSFLRDDIRPEECKFGKIKFI